MGGAKAPKQDPELIKKQQDELKRAEREADRLRRDRIENNDAFRRKQRGAASLITNEGGELGSPRTLLGGGN